MDKLLGRKPAAANGHANGGTDAAPADRVVPLHFFENSLLVQGNNMAVSLVFDDVLDPEKLRSSLEGLIKREGWQRLGGRLKKDVCFVFPCLIFLLAPCPGRVVLQWSLMDSCGITWSYRASSLTSLPLTPRACPPPP